MIYQNFYKIKNLKFLNLFTSFRLLEGEKFSFILCIFVIYSLMDKTQEKELSFENATFSGKTEFLNTRSFVKEGKIYKKDMDKTYKTKWP